MQETSDSWLEYELDDEMGRYEFVGQTLAVAGDLRPHGWGVMTWSDGSRYGGLYASGRKSSLLSILGRSFAHILC